MNIHEQTQYHNFNLGAIIIFYCEKVRIVLHYLRHIRVFEGGMITPKIVPAINSMGMFAHECFQFHIMKL